MPERITLDVDPSVPTGVARAVARRLLGKGEGESSPDHRVKRSIQTIRTSSAPQIAEGYSLKIDQNGVLIEFHDEGGLRAAVATLRQLLREYGRRLPFVRIRDWPDFSRRGVMLDVSRGRVPKLQTLLELVDHLADFKINEFQLYTEHTFAYRKYRSVWRKSGALTGREIRRLDARCRELGIDLVPNQNSFGHLRYFLEHPQVRKLAEVSAPYEDQSGEFLRRPSTLAPAHPGTLPFLRGLYAELLPNFSSQFFNVGCDETWDLGRGQSKSLCERKGKGEVYLDFIRKIHREVSNRKRRMMFWGDIILHHPGLIRQLPREAVALNWGYEADHPFDHEAGRFARSGIPFYVCPGTSTWMTLIGRHDNALENLQRAAAAGLRHRAVGYLITDWGDGGHPQPLAVSYLPYLAGAALSWCGKSFRKEWLVPVLSRDVLSDSIQKLARAAQGLGFAHLKLGYREPNLTPLGAVIAAPASEERELFCRLGLAYYRKIGPGNVRAALAEIEKWRALLKMPSKKTLPKSTLTFSWELDLAARMAAQSCRFMLWQQAAAENLKTSVRLAKENLHELQKLEKDFTACWRVRNKNSPESGRRFLRRRMDELRGFLARGG